MMIVNVFGKRMYHKQRIPQDVLNAANEWALARVRELRLSGIPARVCARPGEPLCVVYKAALVQ